jgi:hypothetical protein
MAIMFIFLKVCLMVGTGILKVPTVGCGLGTSCDYNNRRNIPASCTNIIEKRVVFGLFGSTFIRREYVIIIQILVLWNPLGNEEETCRNLLCHFDNNK